MCPVGLLLLAKNFVGDYLEQENPRVSEMSNEPMKLKLHTTHPFFFVCGGLVYFYYSFAIASFRIFRNNRQLFIDLEGLVRSVMAACVSLEGTQQSQKSCCLVCKICSGLMCYTQLREE